MSDELSIEDRGGYRVLTLNAPGRRNALGTAMIEALERALDEADPASVGAIVLTGAAPAFCSGSNLRELAGLSVPDMCAHEARTARLARRIAMEPVPVIAAVEGYALGGGCILAASCDLVVSARGARWHLPEVENGWLPPWGLGALSARMGPVRARAFVMGFEAIDGVEAHRLGLVDALADDGEALEKAEDMAARIALLPRDAVAETKRHFETAIARGGEQADAAASRAFASGASGPIALKTFAKFEKKQ